MPNLPRATLIRPALIFLTLAAALPARPAPDTFDQSLLPFLNQYCIKCHGPDKQKGDLRLDTLKRDFTTEADAQRWAEVIFRINNGEMPPPKEPQPTPDALGRAVSWIAARLDEGRAARMASRGPVAHYRLSREEYGHTVQDLLGVFYDVNLPGAFNQDPRWHGYERIGAMLSLSPSHVDRYFKAAEIILDRAFPASPPAVAKGKSAPPPPGQRWLLIPGLHKANFHAAAPGLYRLRIQLSALPSFKGRLPHLSLWHQGMKRAIIGQDVIAPEDKPITIELEAFLPEGSFDLTSEGPGMLADGHTLSNTDFPFTTLAERRFKPTGYKLIDDDGKPIFPLLIIDSLEYEGPILTDADKAKRQGLFPTAKNDPAEARKCLERFAARAWRRPPAPAEIDRFVKVMQSEQAAGESFRSAYMAALTAILTSKNFYYLEEGSATQPRETLNDFELASRLSYFLWSSMPDEALFAAARDGSLHQPDTLRAQVDRMLADPKARRFTDAFPRQWLQLHKVGMFPPDPELYPDYDKWLEQCMTLEPVNCFNEVFDKNLSIRQFLSADWTMLNPRLALHYQLPIPKTSDFQRVTLAPEAHRGGLLTQAAILMLTSDGTRHRPVHRGVWVSEAIFNKTPPPPPPNVQPIEPIPNDKPKATVRMQIESHATNAACAACHRRIDPLGLAFDNYNAIGQWRTHEIVATGQGQNPPVNATGQLPDGRPYNTPEEFKQLLVHDIDRFGQAFTEQLATFALRRVLTLDDAAQIRAIAQSSKKEDYRLKSVIRELVVSELFKKR